MYAKYYDCNVCGKGGSQLYGSCSSCGYSYDWVGRKCTNGSICGRTLYDYSEYKIRSQEDCEHGKPSAHKYCDHNYEGVPHD